MSVDINIEAVALELKTEGNKLFAGNEDGWDFCLENRFKEACEKYTEAINICPSAILYGMFEFVLWIAANRSFCHLKMEYCGEAIRDATMAIELDPSYAKGFCFLLSLSIL